MSQLDKAEFFRQLDALNESSDDEQDTNDVSEFMKRAGHSIAVSSQTPSPASSFPSTLPQHSARRSPQSSKKPPVIQRTISAPVSSARVVKETFLVRKNSLLRYGTSTPPSESSFSESTPSAIVTSSQRPDLERRTVSDPSRGTLVLKNSTGIATMLQKKQKRKRDEVKLVPEEDRIFQGLKFFYLPADDKSSVRRDRIRYARNHGANWVKDFGAHVDYLIVDNSLTYQQTMAYFKTLPENIIMVNEEYPPDCISFKALVPPNQEKYAVKGSPGTTSASQMGSQVADDTLDQESNQRQTPPRDDSQSQPEDVEAEPRKDNSSQPPSASSEKHWSLGYSDALDEMIKIAQRMTHLPSLDDDEEEPSSPGGSMQDPDDSDREGSRSPIRAPVKKKRKGNKGPKGSFNQESFSCMTGGTGVSTASNPNERIIEVLSEMAAYYDRIRDQWRSKAYNRAIGSLRKETHKISTFEEAFDIQWIGKSIAKKVEEIVLTDGLRRLEYAKLEPRERVLQDFLKIYGVGLSQANLWIQQGCRTREDLRARVSLTPNQQIGIDHYDDFNTRIPREEITALGGIVKEAAASIDPDVDATIGGSYRRGAQTSGDIDFLISKPGTTTCEELLSFLNVLVQDLTNSGFLVAALAVPTSDTSSSKWHGACVLPGNPIWRRIDFLLVPESEYGAALIYFTGDDIFNRSMRLLAGAKGWRLNQRGLYKNVMRGPGREKLNQGTLIKARDEKKIFEAMAVPWIPPERRILN